MITNEQISSLVNDVAYLEHEAEALKYVIDTVPYMEKPAKDSSSIVETLFFLDHAQQEYYRKVIESTLFSHRPININAYLEPLETFEMDNEKAKDVQKVLHKIAKHRAAIIMMIENRPIVDWERTIAKGRDSITLFSFVQSMVRKERVILKEIADLILSFQNKKFEKEGN